MKTILNFFCLFIFLFIFNLSDAQLSGTYSIGIGGANDYNSLFQALTDLENNGVDGPVVFELADDYSSGTEIYPLLIQTYTGTSEINTLTIKPAAGTSHIIETATAATFSAVFTILDGSHFILDGSNNGSDSRDLLIINTAEIDYTAPIALFTNTTPGTNITVKNCELMAHSNNYSTAGIYSDQFTNVRFENNCICQASIGINVYMGDNITILNNEIGSDIEAEYVVTGIGLDGASNVTVSGNHMKKLIAEYDDNVLIGSYLMNLSGNCLYEKNRIDSVINTGTGTAIGLFVKDCFPAQMDIINNHISHIASDNFPGQMPSAFGVDCPGMTSGMNILYNSISMDVDNTYGIGSAMADGRSCAVLINQGEGIIFKNNIINNTLGERNGASYSTAAFAVICNGSTSPFAEIDHNVWYADGNNDYIYLAAANGTPMNLADWQTYSGGDATSYFEDPLFISSDSLQLQACSPALAHAVYTSTVIDDINGIERDTEYPTMGAYEYEKIQASNLHGIWDIKTDEWIFTVVSFERGTGCKVIVFMKEGDFLPEIPLPNNGNSYVADNNFGEGDEIGATGWYCVYNDNGNSFEVYDINEYGSIYTLMALEYFGTEGNEVYLIDISNFNPNTCFLGYENIEENFSSIPNIFPNPSTGKIIVEIDRQAISNPYCNLQIIDITGKEVYSKQNIFDNKFELDLSHFKEGVYLVQIQTDNNIYSKKLILF